MGNVFVIYSRSSDKSDGPVSVEQSQSNANFQTEMERSYIKPLKPILEKLTDNDLLWKFYYRDLKHKSNHQRSPIPKNFAIFTGRHLCLISY